MRPLFLALVAGGCAKNAVYPVVAEPPPPPMMAPSSGAPMDKDFLEKVPSGRSYQDAVDTTAAESGSPPAPETAEVEQARMVHYTGYARIRATRVHETLDAVAAMAIDRGGRVERLGGNAITVRVPVALFDASWKEVLALGDVIDQNVKAEDVTDAFTEVDLRVKVLRVTRDRLVVLLAKAESEDDKIELLREIQSVTEQLDQFEAQLRTLRGLADYSRITVEVVAREAVANGGAGGPTVDGMAWIAALTPFRRDLGADERRVDLPVPTGLVALSPRGEFVAESPEGVAVWTGRLDNEPRADAGFWVDAITGRLSGDFASAAPRSLGAWRCVELVDASEEPYTWDVCVQVDPIDRKLWLGEVYYPSDDARQRYQPAVDRAFSGGVS